jgi:hypothetical protein
MYKSLNKLIVCSMLFLPATAFSKDEFKLTLSGEMDTQVGYVHQKKGFNFINPADQSQGKLSNSAIVNDTQIKVMADYKMSNGIKYGGLIVLNADTSVNAKENGDNVADKTMIYVESGAGKVQLGAFKSASQILALSANKIAAATGGIDGTAPKWFTKRTIDGVRVDARYMKWPELLTHCECISYSNKVTYLSPKIAGLNFGVSYTPDIAVHGTVTKFRNTPKNAALNDGNVVDGDFRDIVDFGINYETKLAAFNVKLGAIAQHGKAKRIYVARKDLNAFEVGAHVEYKGFSVAGSYGDWLESATPKIRDANKKYGADFWTLGAAYEKGNYNVSITHFQGRRANVYSINPPSSIASHDAGYNKSRYTSVGADYKLAPGFKPYIEYTEFRFKNSNGLPANRGGILLAGTVLSF